jgi:hypothetical protein
MRQNLLEHVDVDWKDTIRTNVELFRWPGTKSPADLFQLIYSNIYLL